MGTYRRSRETNPEKSGPIQELDLLGSVDAANAKYREALHAYLARNKPWIDKIARRENVSPEEKEKLFFEAVALVESFPAEDPTQPSKPILRDLRLQVAEKLGMEDEDLDRIKAYTSVDSPLDILFGGDMFLRIDGRDPDRASVYITFDYTTNPDKKTTKADVLIKELPDPDLEEEKYIKAVDEVALDAHKVFLKGGMRRKTATRAVV